jgi:hypothetical protein
MTNVLPLPDPMKHRDFYEIFEEFTAPPQVKSIQNETAALNADADLSAIAAFSPGVPHQLVSVVICGTANATVGTDATNTSTWVVSDSIGERFNTVFDADPALPAENIPTALIEVATTKASQLLATSYAKLAITNSTNTNTSAALVTFNYYDYNAFPNEQWKIIATNNGFAEITDGVKGVITLSSADEAGSSDNDEIYLVSNGEIFKYAAGKPLVFETTLTVTEDATDDVNLMVGLMDAVAADSLQDDGDGPKASYSGAVIFKVDGGTKWTCESSNSTAQKTNTSTTVRTAVATTLRIQMQPTTSTNYVVTYFVDGQQLRDDTTKAFITHNLTLTSATEMQAVIGLKQGGANTETVAIDRIVAAQLR